MKEPCAVIRDLLPLYADEACSEESRQLVDEHLAECAECTDLLEKLQASEIEDNLKSEKDEVLQYGARRFRRRSATVGSAVSGLFMVPILICLVINLVSGAAMGWFLILLSAMAVAASLVVVPLMVSENKAFWTFCAFCGTLMVLLAVTCIVSRGNWFWIASSASLLGLGLVFLPFVVKAKPLQKYIGDCSRPLLVIGADLALFLNMMNMIRISGSRGGSFLLTLGSAAAAALIVLEIMRKGKI